MLDNVDDLELLRQEFRAEDGSFLLQLRVDLHWDRQAFSRLEQAMRRVCAQQEPQIHEIATGQYVACHFPLGPGETLPMAPIGSNGSAPAD